MKRSEDGAEHAPDQLDSEAMERLEARLEHLMADSLPRIQKDRLRERHKDGAIGIIALILRLRRLNEDGTTRREGF